MKVIFDPHAGVAFLIQRICIRCMCSKLGFAPELKLRKRNDADVYVSPADNEGACRYSEHLVLLCSGREARLVTLA
jgi:hypothetical protein